ncbi:MAG: hypothetical protein CMG60_05670 [Candidatus Marinimicrobia bacterium]|nr:hypothetical protein [Candidatus Neomarinimicrobiota bacterium]|tara:strand:- start:2000 stop:2680 length:681 start_codon:yes stop_codon:yes gene_type:complete
MKKKLLIIFTSISIVLPFSGPNSGMYFDEGFSIFERYIYQSEDNSSTGLGLGFSYLFPQKEINNLDRPTLFQGGIIELNGLYTHADSDDLIMNLLSVGLNSYMGNNIKFGLRYETLIDFDGDLLDFYNNLGYDLGVSSNSNILSVGFYENDVFPFLVFFDLMVLNYSLEQEISLDGNILSETKEDGSTNFLSIGIGYKSGNLAVQNALSINNDKEKRYSINVLYKL